MEIFFVWARAEMEVVVSAPLRILIPVEVFPCHPIGTNTSARGDGGLCPSCPCCRGASWSLRAWLVSRAREAGTPFTAAALA